MVNKYILALLPLIITITIILSSCDDAGVILAPKYIANVTAEDRLAAADSVAMAKYGANIKLVMIFARNMNSDGTANIIPTTTTATSMDSIGTWLYVFRTDPVNPVFKVFTPDPSTTSLSCIEITSAFNVNSFVALIIDTSARNTIANALLTSATLNIGITTPNASLINSNVSMLMSDTCFPVIKYNASYTASMSIVNGNVFNNTGSNKTANMFLIPAVGALSLGQRIPSMTGFPSDLWIVNFTKFDNNTTQNLVLGTVVQSNQTMVTNAVSGKVINLSKDASQ